MMDLWVDGSGKGDWWCGSASGLGSVDDNEEEGIGVCYRASVFLGLPVLVALTGYCVAQVMEMKLKKRTHFPVWLAMRCIGSLDMVRAVACVSVAIFPFTAFLRERSEFAGEKDTQWVPFRVLDFVLIGLLPWGLLSVSWLLHEIRRGSEEWNWLRLFVVMEVIGESIKLWATVRNVESEYEENPDRREFIVVSSVILLVMKSFAAFVMVCFNRDWKSLRFRLRACAQRHNYHGMETLTRNESFMHSLESEEIDEEEEAAASSSRHISEKLHRTPEQYAGLLSRLCFAWLEPLMLSGYNRPLEQTDFYKLLRDDETTNLSRNFSEAFFDIKREEELREMDKNAHLTATDDSGHEYSRLESIVEEENNDNGNRQQQEENDDDNKGNLSTIVWALHQAGTLRPFYEAAFFKFIYDSLIFVGPQLLRRMVQFLQKPDAEPKEGYIIAGLMFLSAATQTFVLHIYFHRVFRTGMRVRSALLTSIYRKSLRLTPSSRQKRTTGEVVNLMSSDCTRLNMLFPYLHVTWSSPYQVALSLFFLWSELKYAVLVAVAVIFLVMTPLTAFVAGRIKTIQKELMKVKDERIRRTGEAITSIKVIKLYGWERTFREMIKDARDDELQLLRRYVKWRALGRTLWSSTSIMVTLCTFAAFVAMGGTLDAATAFTSLSLLSILRFPLAVLPNIFNSAIEASVSLRRIASFLYSEEIDFEALDEIKRDLNMPDGYAVSVKHGNFFWDDLRRSQALFEIDFEVRIGELCLVTGEVGSGKSALLKMLIGELQPGLADLASGDLPKIGVHGSVAYAAQSPWIQNATVRENILFGSPYDRDWYNRVVYACALASDFDQLADGDQTEIGERGINLSGGQKARVALARAVYSRADVLFLETCFEAVDEHVGAFLWKNCFRGILTEPHPVTKTLRTVLLVTHALKYADEADGVLVLKKGRIVEQGSAAEIRKSNRNSELARLSVRVEQLRNEAKAGSSSSPSNEDERRGSNADVMEDQQKFNDLMRRQSSLRRKKDGKAGGQGALIGEEERSVGRVSWSVYFQYVRAVGGWFVALIAFMGFLVRTILDVGTSAWLAFWSSHVKPSSKFEQQVAGRALVEAFESVDVLLTAAGSSILETGVFEIHGNDTLSNGIKDELNGDGGQDTGFYLGIYAALSIGGIIFIGLLTLYFAMSALTASRSMHAELVMSVCRAPMAFFDTTPIGRVLNRFSKDIYSIDETLPDSLYSFVGTTFQVLGTFGTIAAVVPPFFGVIPFMVLAYFYVQRYYIASSRELKRWDAVLRSPIYSHFSESLDGSTTIRAYGASQRFIKQNQIQLDIQLGAYYLSIAANRWLAVRLEFIGNFLVLSTAVFLVAFGGSINAAFAGLCLSYSLNVTQTLNWTVRMSVELENNVVSVERINEYIEIKSEAGELCSDPSKVPPEEEKFPKEGTIEFDNVFARYRPGLEDVLKAVTFRIEAGEKTAIVGRTGSGKSTLFLCLMRLIEPRNGRIYIDGYDVSNFGLERLRQGVAIIPQDPVMFRGTVRQNLDPKKQYTDAEIWQALEKAQMRAHIEGLASGSNQQEKDGALSFMLTEGGSNFSFGERQLIGVARAILRQCKILLMDEASSGLDASTDEILQKTIREEFRGTTTLTVAHRLETIMDSNVIIVMSNGSILEKAPPSDLLKDQNSEFFKLVQKMKNST